MKKLLISFSLILLFVVTGKAQQQPATAPKPETISVSETSFDFGKIPQGKPVTHNFIVTNISKDSLKIEHIQASCGCTTPEWNKDVVKAGNSTTIKVGYNAASEGPFEKAITIYYNGGQTKMITVKGNVWKTPEQPAPNNEALNVFKQ
ncbi:MAG: DUF1573 domain-containing protein [Lacibacter sp.]